MSKKMSFKSDIERFQHELEQAKGELAELEAQLKTYDVHTQKCREIVQAMRDQMAGRPVSLSRTSRTGGSKIEALSVNPETGRPPRGDRRNQIELICKKLGRGGKQFRTIDVLHELEHVEDELSSGMKSYTYAVLTTLQKEKALEKVGRGTWKLK